MTENVYIDGLPVIQNCDGCCACCMEQGSPPGYLPVAAGQYSAEKWFDEADPEGVRRWADMPRDAKETIYQYLDRLRAGETSGDGPCCWLDTDTMQCRWHEWRPQICRDFAVGSEDCHGWRDEYDVFRACLPEDVRS